MNKRLLLKLASVLTILVIAPIAMLMIFGKSDKSNIISEEYKAHADVPVGGGIGCSCCEGAPGCCGAGS